MKKSNNVHMHIATREHILILSPKNVMSQMGFDSGTSRIAH